VRVIDRASLGIKTSGIASELGRDSFFKRSPDRYVVVRALGSEPDGLQVRYRARARDRRPEPRFRRARR
jgi:hypothetical protein